MKQSTLNLLGAYWPTFVTSAQRLKLSQPILPAPDNGPGKKCTTWRRRR